MVKRVMAVAVALALSASGALCADINVKPGHQRLGLMKGDVERAAKNIEADGANWRTLKSRIDAGTASAPAYGIVYLATGDEAVGKKGVEVLMNEKATGEAESIALGYDWLYALLTDEQKAALFERISKAVARTFAEEPSAPWTNFVQRACLDITLAGCAFTPEFPEAQKYVDKAYKDWKEFHLPAALVTGEGGGWPEGTLYSYIVYSCLARVADAFTTATDKDIWLDTPWFADRAAWWMFHTWPLPKSFHGRAFYMYDPYGDSEKWRAPMQNQEIWGELVAMRYFETSFKETYPNAPRETTEGGERRLVDFTAFRKGSENAKTWRWYMRQLGGPIASLGDWAILTYYDETGEAVVPEHLSWYAKGTGQVFIRSSWKPDATWLTLQCGPRFTYHQHVDQGQVNIFKMGDLTGESGVYEPSGPSEEDGHLQGYASRAIAHNTINIYNPSEIFSGYRSGNSPRNDGGQRTWRPFSNTATTAEVWKDGFTKGAYDTGRIVEFEDEGHVVYCAMDLTGAYNSDKYVSEPNKSKVHEVTRQVVYLRPDESVLLDCAVVFDRVRATEASFEKRILWHFPNDVLVSGTETRVAEGEFSYDGDLAQTDTGGGRLFIRSVYPKGAKINKVGGPDKEYWIFGRNFPVPDTPWERGYAQWRLEIMPPAGQADDCFLTVFFPMDKSATAAPKVVRLSGNKTLGVEIGYGPMKYKVLFASEGAMAALVRRDVGDLGAYVSFEVPLGESAGIDRNASDDGVNDTTFACPEVKDVKVSDVTTQAAVEWETTGPATGYVEFGATPEMKYIVGSTEGLGARHRAVLRGLEPESKVYVRAAAKDAGGNTGFSKMIELAAPADTTPPKISNLKIERANPTDATVSWSTDDLATGVVECVGPGGAKVSVATVVAGADQRVTVDGLKPETQYTVTVTARNTVGMETWLMKLTKTPKKMEGYFEADFEDGKADGFEMTSLEFWKVEKDGRTGVTALVLSKTQGVRNLAIVKGSEYGDFKLRFKARTFEGDGNKWRDYCAVFGYVDAKNYYMVGFNSSADELTPGILCVKDGKEQAIGRRINTVTIGDRGWHNIEVTRRGTTVEVYWDGALCFEADDATFGKGRIGFGSNNDSAGFDDIKILPEAGPKLAAPEIRTKKVSIEGLVIE